MIGIAAAYGLAMEVARRAGARRAGARLERAARGAADGREPRLGGRSGARRRAHRRPGGDGRRRPGARREAIHAQEDAASAALAGHGAELLAAAGARRILTHCNTGALATGGRGSALAVIAELAARTAGVEVLACETRPLLQGARLTVWELRRLGLPHALLVDAAAAGLIRRGEVDAVIVGFDRVAANGDVANKVGTYAHALAAQAAGIPFVVAGPMSSIDASLAARRRDRDRGARCRRGPRTPAVRCSRSTGTPCRNPAFDVTPAALVTALVTERGVAALRSGQASRH